MTQTTYITRSGDTWDSIAKQVYGSEWHADHLMQQNGKLLAYFVFPAGIELQTPALPARRDAALPPWR